MNAKISQAPLAVVAALALALADHASAQDAAEKNERCATRLSMAFLGRSPDAALRASLEPQGRVDDLLRAADFRERFARFVNAAFNDEPGETPEQDPAYFLSLYILENDRPWKELFLGPYRVDVVPGSKPRRVAVMPDPDGLGYFRSIPWLKRYAGNEEEGYKLATAYRMVNNTLGLELVPATNAPGVDISATGRRAANCAGCHYHSIFALDKIALILTKRVGTGDPMTFAPPEGPPQLLLGDARTGKTVASDRELVTALVDSEEFRFRSCRLAMQFLYGRAENRCEGAVFDRCMDAFGARGTLQAALGAIAKDPSFCP